MPLGVDAGIRITLGLLTETDLFLRCQSDDLVGEPLLFQGKKAFSATVLVIVFAVR